MLRIDIPTIYGYLLAQMIDPVGKRCLCIRAEITVVKLLVSLLVGRGTT
jgi:hypothetical protein